MFAKSYSMLVVKRPKIVGKEEKKVDTPTITTITANICKEQ